MTDNEKQPEVTEKNDTELSLGERIQKKRKELDLSAEELVSLIASFDFSSVDANEKGISLPTIYRYEKGEREPGAREIRFLCDALNVSADWLVFGKAWNWQQDADTTLAEAFRVIVKRAYDEELFDRNVSRNNMHYMKLCEVKNRNKH